MEIDYKTMEEKAAEQAAERDRKFSEAMQELQERKKRSLENIGEMMEKAVANNEGAESKMNEEIAAVEAEAADRINRIRKHYAENYGGKEWNETAEESLRKFVKSF